jgi:kynureninase
MSDAHETARSAALALDEVDPLRAKRGEFLLPPGIIYLDGNSLGPLHRDVATRVHDVVTYEWGTGLVRSWNDAGWIDLPRRVAARIARLVGAAEDEVWVGDSTSIQLFKVVSAALALRPERSIIVAELGNFPGDLYVTEARARMTGHTLRLVDARAGDEAIQAALDDDVVALMLTQVDFRSGRRLDLDAWTRAAHDVGAAVIWDLAHSAGAFPVDLTESGADFAVGCGYKYLNGGPGAPTFVYARREHHAMLDGPLVGWLGHDDPFAFDPRWSPTPGLRRLQIGTPALLSMVALDAALAAFDDVDLRQVRRKSEQLAVCFLEGLGEDLHELGLTLASPCDPARRGSHLALRHDAAFAVIQALIADGVIGDFRAPDLLRFGFAPLFNTHLAAFDAGRRLREVLQSRGFREARFQGRRAVT